MSITNAPVEILVGGGISWGDKITDSLKVFTPVKVWLFAKYATPPGIVPVGPVYPV